MDLSRLTRGRLHGVLLHLLVPCLYLLVALAMTWPLATRLDDGLIKGTWWWDGYTNTMIMETRAQGLLGQGAGSLYQYYWYAPLEHTVVFNENELVLSLFYLPFRLVGCEPLTAHNLVLMLSLALGGYGMFLLARRLTRCQPAGFFAGLAFAFCPFVLFELSRIQLVATLWVPLCFLFLHRALTRGRWTDWGGLALACVCQVGTGMYYALFLVPLLGAAAVWLALRRGLRRVRWRRLAVSGAAAAVVVAAMVWPYVATRDDLGLTFDRDYIARTDGALAGLLHVNPENRVWTVLHHDRSGGSESSAFPGLTPVLLALVALGGPLLAARRREQAPVARLLLCWSVVATAAGIAAVTVGHGLATLPVVGLAGWFWWRQRRMKIFPTPTGLYLALLVLAVTLFTGVSWGEAAGREVVGLYDALRAWVPGFDSVRRVERLALMVMLPLCVLAALGLTLLLGRLRRRWQRAALTAVCCAALLGELWSAPMPLADAVSAADVPEVYRWLRRQPGQGPIASIPARRGERTFRGDIGGSLHNYLTIFHRKRTVLGFSTWDSPLTQALNHELDTIPLGADPLPLLRAARVRYVVLHGGDLEPDPRRRVRAYLAGPHFREAFRAGSDVVYRIVAPPLPLRPTPPRPDLELRPEQPARQSWDQGGVTAHLRRATRIATLEIRYTPGPATFATPLAWAIDVSQDGRTWRTVVEQREPTLFHDQLHRPARFVFRVNLPGAPSARAVRLRALTPALIPATGRLGILSVSP